MSYYLRLHQIMEAEPERKADVELIRNMMPTDSFDGIHLDKVLQDLWYAYSDRVSASWLTVNEEEVRSFMNWIYTEIDYEGE